MRKRATMRAGAAYQTMSRLLADPTLWRRVAIAWVFTATAGCFQSEGVWQKAPDVVGPERVGTRLVFGERTRQSLLVVDVDGGVAASIGRVDLPGAPTALKPLPGGQGVVVLQSEAQVLSLVRFDGSEPKHWPLGTAFTAVEPSPEADGALVYFAKDSTAGVFSNNHQLGFVDFDQPSEAEPLRRSLASLGGKPESFHVSPQVGDTRYGFVLSDSHIAIVDLLRPESAERSVPLVSLVTGGLRRPKDVAFAVEDSGRTLWGVVTTSKGETAFALEVVPNDAVGPAAPFDVRLTQLAGVAGGADVALAAMLDGRLVALLLNPYTGVLTVTDLASASSQTIELGAGMVRLDVFVSDGKQHALVYTPGRDVFHVVDIEAVASKKVKAVRTRYAHRPIERIVPVAGTALFGAIHNDADEAFSIIDTAIDRVTPFLQTGLIRDVVVDTDSARVFLLTYRSAEDQAYVVSVTLDEFFPQTARAFGGADKLFVMPESGTVAVVSNAHAGHLQMWPTTPTTDASAFRIPNLFAHELANSAEAAQ